MTDPETIVSADVAAPLAEEAVEVAKPAIVTVARLDADGVYLGVEALPAEELTEAHFPVPADCDLKPGAYKLAGAAFVPIEPVKQRALNAPVSSDRAFYDLCLHFQSQKILLPERTLVWMTQYKQTIDAQ